MAKTTLRATAFRLRPGIGLTLQQQLGDGWILDYAVQRAERDGRFLGIRSLTIRPQSGIAVPDGGITRAVLARVKLGAIRRHAARILAPPTREEGPVSGPGRPGRPPTRTAAFYQQLARRYEAMYAAGEGNIPKRLAEEFGDMNRNTMRSLLRRAQLMGLFSSQKGSRT